MPVYFRTGVGNAVKYDFCPDEMIYLKVGEYELDLENEQLKYLTDDELDPIKINGRNIKSFCDELRIDRSKDSKIHLTLNKKGTFYRNDASLGKSTIKTLFFA